jgi:RHS repeat-associated protein
VSAIDAAANESDKSTPASATTTAPDTAAPSVPTALTATATGPNSVTVSWSASTDNVGVTSYTVSNGTSSIKVSGTATSVTDARTAPWTAYTYTVTATDAAGNVSAASTGAPVTTPAPDTHKPSVPTALVATPAPTEIDLAWSASTDDTGVAGYTIARDGVTIATTYSPTYADIGVPAGTAHTYAVSAFDGAGNASDPNGGAVATAEPALPVGVGYAYDLADRLTAITTASGSTTAFSIDALGRHGSRTVGTAPTESYAYLGTSDIVVAITTGSTITKSAIDAVGDRVATASGGSFGYLLPDLHGNGAAAFDSGGASVSDAFAYDVWGTVVASVTSALPTPWRYQGRILESAAGTPELYDFAARSYNPGLGTFTSLDTVHGSAGNPALLNGYLYANANPATLVDPDGHCSGAGYGGSCTDTEMTHSSGRSRYGGPGGEGPCPEGGYNCTTQNVTLRSDVKHDNNMVAAAEALKPRGGNTATHDATDPMMSVDQAKGYASVTSIIYLFSQGCSVDPRDADNCYGQLAGGIGNWARGQGYLGGKREPIMYHGIELHEQPDYIFIPFGLGGIRQGAARVATEIANPPLIQSRVVPFQPIYDVPRDPFSVPWPAADSRLIWPAIGISGSVVGADIVTNLLPGPNPPPPDTPCRSTCLRNAR